MLSLREKKDKFCELLFSTKREGIESLLAWLESTDFFTAPASTRFHGSHEGGLLEHSLAVYEALSTLKCNLPYFSNLNVESIIIVSLLHDICKADCYIVDYRNVKVDGEWTKQPYYKFEEQFNFGGHGSKSLFLASKHIKLSDEEAAAINAHMGAWDMTTYSNPSGVYDTNPLAFALHMADEIATYAIKA